MSCSNCGKSCEDLVYVEHFCVCDEQYCDECFTELQGEFGPAQECEHLYCPKCKEDNELTSFLYLESKIDFYSDVLKYARKTTAVKRAKKKLSAYLDWYLMLLSSLND